MRRDVFEVGDQPACFDFDEDVMGPRLGDHHLIEPEITTDLMQPGSYHFGHVDTSLAMAKSQRIILIGSPAALT